MSEISTPHNFEFEEIFMNGSWIEASPPPDHPDFKSYVSVSSVSLHNSSSRLKLKKLL
ncbi:MAG: hypothetical protein IIC67_00010 [Thaumarchaeota archaeon]|nr:hypothetical protein [Nitrososphaerota archaeon]